MAPKCSGLCDKEPKRMRNPYSNGFKRCSTCVKFVKSDELRCYCCQTKLRKYSHKGKCKKVKLEAVARY
jgi:hypothetical protein